MVLSMSTRELHFFMIIYMCGFSHVVIVGDMNTSHKRIDHCDPDPAMVRLCVVVLK